VLVDVSAVVGTNVGSWSSPSFIVGLDDSATRVVLGEAEGSSDAAAAKVGEIVVTTVGASVVGIVVTSSVGTAVGGLVRVVLGDAEGSSDAEAPAATVGGKVETAVGDAVGIAVTPSVGTTVGGVMIPIVVGRKVGGESMDSTNVGKTEGAMEESSSSTIITGDAVGTALSMISMGSDVGNTVEVVVGIVVAATGDEVLVAGTGVGVMMMMLLGTDDGLSLSVEPRSILAGKEEDGLSLGESDAASSIESTTVGTIVCRDRPSMTLALTSTGRRRRKCKDRQRGPHTMTATAANQVKMNEYFGKTDIDDDGVDRRDAFMATTNGLLLLLTAGWFLWSIGSCAQKQRVDIKKKTKHCCAAQCPTITALMEFVPLKL
jgi:hypothetical protein